MLRRLAESRAARTGVNYEFAPIAGLSPDGVAEALRGCHVFLATGFPEGCPLPPLEALACGCLVAGFAGFGGFDYLRPIGPGGYMPPVPLREVPWGGNGFYAADNDVFGATLCLEAAAKLWIEGGPALTAALESAAMTAAAYTPQAQQKALAAIWSSLAG